MIRVELQEKGGGARVFEFHKPEVTLGRVQGNDIVLPKGNVSKRHARCVYKDERYILVDLKSTNGTYVNGRKITSPLVIREDDKIYIGDFTLTFGPLDSIDDDDTAEVDATELRLLAGVAQRDEASRLVYADWLEEQGDPVRAEFLRVSEELARARPGEAAFVERTERLRELADHVDLQWRYKVARPLVENCFAVEYECPRDWGSLAATEKSTVRYCSACAKRVYYCPSIEEGRRHAQRGDCVAIDIVPLRRPRDLEPARATMVMGRMIAPRPPPQPPQPPQPRPPRPSDTLTAMDPDTTPRG